MSEFHVSKDNNHITKVFQQNKTLNVQIKLKKATNCKSREFPLLYPTRKTHIVSDKCIVQYKNKQKTTLYLLCNGILYHKT